MNLIFEDRWLLAENNPTVALQNQLRRRMKVDIRDPDPDTANFPNGAYTLPKGRVYIENSPVGFYGRSSASRSPVQLGIPVSLRHDRQPRVPHLLQRPDRDQGQERDGRRSRLWPSTSRSTSGKRTPSTGCPPWGSSSTSRPRSARPHSTAALSHRSICSSTTRCLWGSAMSTTSASQGAQGILGENVYQFSYQWSLQRQVVQDFDVFWQGFYNATALPRVRQFTQPQMRLPSSHQSYPCGYRPRCDLDAER